MSDVLKNINEFLPTLKVGQTYTLPSGYEPAVYADVDNLWLRKTPTSAQPELSVNKNTYLGEVKAITRVDNSDTRYRAKVHLRKETPAGVINLGEFWVNLGKVETTTGRLILPYIQIINFTNVKKEDTSKLVNEMLDIDRQMMEKISKLPEKLVKDPVIEQIIINIGTRQELTKNDSAFQTIKKELSSNSTIKNLLVFSNPVILSTKIFSALYKWGKIGKKSNHKHSNDDEIGAVPLAVVIVVAVVLVATISTTSILIYKAYFRRNLDAKKDFSTLNQKIEELHQKGMITTEVKDQILEAHNKDVENLNKDGVEVENKGFMKNLTQILTLGAVVVGGVLAVKLLKK